MLKKLLAMSFLLIGCAHSPKPEKRDPVSVAEEDHKRQLLVGKWLGTNLTDDGQPMEALVNRKVTGEYEATFLIGSEKPRFCSQVKGLWGVSSDIYFTIIKEVNNDGSVIKMKPQDSEGYHAYKVLDLNQNDFHFESTETKVKLHYKKVDENAVMKEKGAKCPSVI